MPIKYSAHFIFPGGLLPLKRGIVVLDDQKRIVDLIDTRGNLSESHSLIFYDGILTPGFPDINLFANSLLPVPDNFPDTRITIKNSTTFDLIKTVQETHPEVSLQSLIDWASVFLSEYLGLQDAGSIRIGKKPGLNFISNIDFRKMQLTSQSELKVLV